MWLVGDGSSTLILGVSALTGGDGLISLKPPPESAFRSYASQDHADVGCRGRGQAGFDSRRRVPERQIAQSDADRRALLLQTAWYMCQQDRAAANAMLLECIDDARPCGGHAPPGNRTGGLINSVGGLGVFISADHLKKAMVQVADEWGGHDNDFFKKETPAVIYRRRVVLHWTSL